MRQVLDIVALRSFVGVADCGGFHRAGEVLRISQSAVSQHVRRLEKVVGRPLVERRGRQTEFTLCGHKLLAEARLILAAHDDAVRRVVGAEQPTVTVGATDHAADQLLPVITRALAASHPDHLVRFRIDRTSRLDEAVGRGSLDLAVAMAEVSSSSGLPLGALPLTWYAADSWTPPAPGADWPVVAIDEPCLIRRRALEALTARGHRPYVVCDTGYVSGVLNAARAGLGVALIAGIEPPDGLVARPDLPAVNPAELGLISRRGLDPALVTSVSTALRTALTSAGATFLAAA